MSHVAVYTGWRKAITQMDNKIPFIAIFALIGMIVYTVGEHFHVHAVHHLHNHTLHAVANHWGMWLFFAYLGLEIKLEDIRRAGTFVLFAIVGGMVVPPLFTLALVGSVYIAIGSAATDVAFSLGGAKLIQGGKSTVLSLLVASLLLLAVGDDLGGVAIMTGMYAGDRLHLGWLALEIIILTLGFFLGEGGKFQLRRRPQGTDEVHVEDLDVVLTGKGFWLGLAVANTIVLYLAGIEWILGGCLLFIFAPSGVKDDFIKTMTPFIPIVLALFGLVNGSINLADSANWGKITAGCFIGGMFGKQIGIFVFGLIGRAKSKGTLYGRIPLRQIYGLAMLASVNGTVAIVFINTGLSNGMIDPAQGQQAILGFFLTVPAVYIQAVIAKAWLKDDPGFQPDGHFEGDPIEAPAH
jgi:hypothetical protein